MNKDTLFYGIDISKDVFDVMDEKGVHYQFENNYSGFKKYLKLLANHSYFVTNFHLNYYQCCLFTVILSFFF